LTSDEFATRFRSRRVTSYEQRKRRLISFLKRFRKPYDIVEISDSYGVATLSRAIDAIVVSEETMLRAEEINTIRFKKGLPKIVMIVVPLVLGKGGRPLSSGG